MKPNQAETVNSVMQDELVQFGKMLNVPEAREAFMAFFQKRKPDFSQFS